MRLARNLNRDATFQHVEALFKRVQVRCYGPPCIEKTNPGAHVNRTHRALYIRGAAEAGTVGLVKLGCLRGGWVDPGNSMHGVVDLLWLLSTLREVGGIRYREAHFREQNRDFTSFTYEGSSVLSSPSAIVSARSSSLSLLRFSDPT